MIISQGYIIDISAPHFSLKGIRQEIKNVHWLTKKELARDAFVVLAFTVILGVYFYGADALIALILKTLGLS